MKARRPSMLAATALAAALVLGACGSDDEPAASSDASQSPAADAEPASLTKDTFAQEVAEAQAEAGSVHLTMTVDAGGQKITAEGDAEVGDSPEDTAVSMTMDTGQAGAMDMVLVDEVMYMRMGQMTDGKFVKIDLTDTSNPVGKQYSGLVDQLDPAAQLEQLQAALSGFEKSGEPESIDGVQAQPYDITVDTAQLAETSGQDMTGAPQSIEYTMWIGPDNLIRRMESATVGQVTVDYTGWGQDVEISAPKASEVSDQDPFASMS